MTRPMPYRKLKRELLKAGFVARQGKGALQSWVWVEASRPPAMRSIWSL